MSISVTVLTVIVLAFVPGWSALHYLSLWKRLDRFDRPLAAMALSLLLSPALLYVVGHVVPVSAFSALGSALLFATLLFIVAKRFPSIFRNIGHPFDPEDQRPSRDRIPGFRRQSRGQVRKGPLRQSHGRKIRLCGVDHGHAASHTA